MDKPIAVGDMIVVVRWPHEHGNALGHLYRVRAFAQRCRCEDCKKMFEEPCVKVSETGSLPISWVKRIPPLEELEGQRTEESLRQPRKDHVRT